MLGDVLLCIILLSITNKNTYNILFFNKTTIKHRLYGNQTSEHSDSMHQNNS